MWKKVSLAIFALASMSGLAFGLANPDTIENVPGLNFKTSTNVIVVYKWDTTGATTQNYGLASKHTSGDTYYATSNVSTAIFKLQDSTKKGVALTVGDANVADGKLAATGESIFTGYTAM